MSEKKFFLKHGDGMQCQSIIYGPDKVRLEFSGSIDDIGDEYHTMHELYQHRMLLNAALFNTWHAVSKVYRVCKSKLHSDGTMFDGGYFVVVAQTPAGMISYHYTLKHWDLFRIPEVDRAPEYDGHTAADVLDRLASLT